MRGTSGALDSKSALARQNSPLEVDLFRSRSGLKDVESRDLCNLRM